MLSIFSNMNSIWYCTTKTFDALLTFMFLWTVNILLQIMFSTYRWRSNSFYSQNFAQRHFGREKGEVLFRTYVSALIKKHSTFCSMSCRHKWKSRKLLRYSGIPTWFSTRKRCFWCYFAGPICVGKLSKNAPFAHATTHFIVSAV